MSTRKEHDLLGDRDVPADAYYGVQTLRAFENFNITGVRLHQFDTFINAFAQVKKAAALANHEVGALDGKIKDAIVAACDEIIAGALHDQFIVDMIQGGAGTSTNMNVNEVIANRALEILGHQKGEYQYCHPNNHVNHGQSTNDAYPTALHVALDAYIERLIGSLKVLHDSFMRKSREFGDKLKMGRTHLQDAVPMTAGQEFNAFATMIATEIDRLDEPRRRLDEINMGATAIGTGLNAPAGYAAACARHLAAITGKPYHTAEDLIQATQDTSGYVHLSGNLRLIATRLSKIANDLRLLSSGPRAGLANYHLPDRQPGSSIMPGKVNPVIPEVVNQTCFHVLGIDHSIALAAEAGQLQLNVMEPVIAQAIFESISLLGNACVNLADKCVDGITANRETCAAYVLNSIGIVTYLNPFIGHHNGDKVGKICAQTGKNVREVVLELGLLSAEQLDDILSPANLINPQYKAKKVG